MKILLVEDSRAMAAVLGARLKSYGFEVTHADNGEKAVQAFALDRFDMVLMDIDMPVMDGFEATQRIRANEFAQHWSWTPIMILTASDSATNLVAAISAGADDFLSKTAPEEVLVAKLTAMTRIAALRSGLMIANQWLDDDANRDGLTGIANRRALDRQIDTAWRDAVERGESFGLIMVDIDNFKKYNDHYGHAEGDACLRAVAQTLGRVIAGALANKAPKGCLAARYGGEEFALMLPAIAPELLQEIATQALESVRALAVAHQPNAGWGIVTISAGAAHTKTATDNINQLFRHADEALYRAKEGGRNRVEFWAEA